MLTEKDYCDYDTCVALREVGCRIETEWYIHQPSYERGSSCYLCFGIPRETSVLDECDYIPRLSLYEAQKWLREEKGIHIAPRIYLYHDINLDERTSWECTIYVEWSAIYTIGKSLTYEDALLLGIKEAVKILKEK